MNDSWESFRDVLREECTTFRALNEKAIALSTALVENGTEKIRRAQDAIEVARKNFVAASMRRRSMQKRGFGDLALRSVAGYAPPQLRSEIGHRAAELTYLATSLEIVNSNNRALILSGMERLMNVVSVLQRAQAKPLPYKRRGVIPPLNGSVIMSKQA
ncbi:MAG: hypothetical protein JO101_10700 [Candidatus Eremiobacteraeota bacterium]|nr:hypothetical protein [Candidatus Eremiobacteraeota bacterium]MBV8355779.1 hypothetical protein [Candidatus Eremiobacteraeota bacterium]